MTDDNFVDLINFQRSITEELDIIKNRVRNLIGGIHWGEEGRFKEAILRNIISKFLPSNLSIGTGFVIKKYNNHTDISNQIDIIIYDNTIPPLFSEGDFVITTYKNVKGIVEVKTRIKNARLENVITTAEENGKLIGDKKIFNGIFSYEYSDSIESETIDRVLGRKSGYVNHISLGKNIFVKFWKESDKDKLQPPIDNCESDFYNLYKIDGLSFSYFISNLIESTCSSNLDDRWWFLYPIQETKETRRIRTIPLNT